MAPVSPDDRCPRYRDVWLDYSHGRATREALMSLRAAELRDMVAARSPARRGLRPSGLSTKADMVGWLMGRMPEPTPGYAVRFQPPYPTGAVAVHDRAEGVVRRAGA